MNALGRALAARIRATGPISLADWMAEALGHPTLGYYRRGDPLGARGDFTTAPEISQVFGELIGFWLIDAWDRLRRPDPVLIVELGPGRGTLMAAALRAAKLRPEFLGALRLHLVESSPGLRGRQAAALAGTRPIWHDGVETIPPGPLLLVANEFFDALPVRQFQRTETGWRERMVALDEPGEVKARARNSLPISSGAIKRCRPERICSSCSGAACARRRSARSSAPRPTRNAPCATGPCASAPAARAARARAAKSTCAVRSISPGSCRGSAVPCRRRACSVSPAALLS